MHYFCSRRYRRRRRRGHANNTKRMAVDASPTEQDNDFDGMTDGVHSAGLSACASAAGRCLSDVKSGPAYRKVGMHHHRHHYNNPADKKTSMESPHIHLDSFGMKRKRNILGCNGSKSYLMSSSCPESGGGGGTSGPQNEMDDEEMKSDEEEDDSEYYSTSAGEDEKDADDTGREGKLAIH
jgi:hypothetical protein